MSDFRKNEKTMSDLKTIWWETSNLKTNRENGGNCCFGKVWSDPCGAWLVPGLKPLRLPRAQSEEFWRRSQGN